MKTLQELELSLLNELDNIAMPGASPHGVVVALREYVDARIKAEWGGMFSGGKIPCGSATLTNADAYAGKLNADKDGYLKFVSEPRPIVEITGGIDIPVDPELGEQI